MDLNERKEKGENVDSRDIKKHKNDILRIITEFMLEKIDTLPETIHIDVENFIMKLKVEPFDENLLRNFGLSNEDIIERLGQMYGAACKNR